MKAGRELDALIAEKVFGKICPGFEFDYVGPHYSTQIADAWLVVEKMWDLGGFRVAIIAVDDGQYECDFDDMRATFTLQADTAPLAICLAALKAAD